jgi:hypothetical protein
MNIASCFSQVATLFPMHTTWRCVQRYQNERYVKRSRYLDQYISMEFAQIIQSG